MDIYLKEILEEDALLWVVAMLVSFGMFAYIETNQLHGVGLMIGGAAFSVVRSFLKRKHIPRS